MRFAVTGGAGFIGSNICSMLIRDGHEVVAVDDLSSGKAANLDHLKDEDAFRFVRGSINDPATLDDAFDGVDVVLHLAAIASVPRSMSDPYSTNRANIKGSLDVLHKAHENGVRKVVCSSSSAVYGDTEVMPTPETEPPMPKSPYAVSKLAMEMYCSIFGSEWDMDTVCLRYFNVFGPRQDPGSQYAAAIPIFIDRCLRGESPIIYGDGKQTRDFVFVDDVYRANLLAATGKANGVFNIASGHRTTILELCETIRDITGCEAPTVFEDERPGDIRHSVADVARAERDLGFRPEHGFEDALAETVEWYRGREED